ncbi:MAG: glycosyltransferase family 2 protein [Candidatus Marinimicrobia bacterium]|nr:glycosyltransferase family 2 protein [Candidatus Neomarinimicrobiota bacterium]
MTNHKEYSPRGCDGPTGWFWRLAASGLLPAAWFRDPLPPAAQRTPGPALPTLEIVSHCWRYAHMLTYQLNSLINYPPTRLKVIVTVFYAEEDADTRALLDRIAPHDLENVVWNWQALPPPRLFRRGIGRNLAARATRADWVWMADCDILFHAGCLDALAAALRGRRDTLLFPRQERTTPMLPATSALLQNGRLHERVDINPADFQLHTRDRAKGAYQIIHGDVARAIGYCDGIALYQTPARHWCKCYEDRAFRWLAGTQGTPIDVPGVYQIRHIEKGRYRPGTLRSRLRSKIRRLQE